MSKGTAHRSIRIEDGLWSAARTKAETEGKNLSDLIRCALRAYVEEEQDWESCPKRHASQVQHLLDCYTNQPHRSQ